MSDQPVSAYAASRLLGRDRQTIERAVRHLAPDAYERGQPRWQVARIADALAKPPRERREAGKYRDRYGLGRNKVLDGLRLTIERQIMLIGEEELPAKRREMALALAPALQEFQVLYLSTARSLGIADDDAICARSEMIFSEWMDEVSAAAVWPRYGYGADFFISMLRAMPGADDDEAV